MRVSALIKIFTGLAIAILIVSFGWWSSKLGLPSELPDTASLRRYFEGLGVWGPVAVIGSMFTAILISPIPSAPIALAAGAIYGHFWGSLYVLAGSELGALGAFAIARFLGYDLMRKWLGDRLTSGLTGSQNFLMGTVFISRLLPFISFDIVSYAAGLTPLSFWRFAVATLAGIIPASFLLAHLGSELMTEESDRIMFSVLLLGIIVAIPLGVELYVKFRRR